MATTTYIPTKNWFDILRLAGGDHFKSTLDTTTNRLVNTTVTQAALDQAIIDNANGVKSAIQIAIDHEASVDNISLFDLAAAVVGDTTSLTKLSSALTPVPGVTPSPTASISHNFSATRDPLPSDNTTSKYGVSSFWVNLTAKSIWFCTNATNTTATWVIISPPTPANIPQQMNYRIIKPIPPITDFASEQTAKLQQLRNQFLVAANAGISTRGFQIPYTVEAIDEINTRVYLSSAIGADSVYIYDANGVLKNIPKRDASRALRALQHKNHNEMVALYTAEVAVRGAINPTQLTAIVYNAGTY